MNQNQLEYSFDDKLEQLDLEPIKFLLMHPERGEGWTLEEVDRVGEMYKRFLYLIYMYPTITIIPSKKIDAFWHMHILDTQKYAEDCQILFGRFVHHFPYFGSKDETDMDNLVEQFEKTVYLYKKHFNVDIATDLMGDAGVCGDPATLSLNAGVCGDPATLSLNAGVCGDPATLSLNAGVCGDPATLSLNAGVCGDPATLSLNAGVCGDPMNISSTKLTLFRPRISRSV